MEKETIVRKDGIVYERKKRTLNQTKTITLRISQEKLNQFKVVAGLQDKKYQSLLKELIDNYIKENRNECKRDV